MATRFAPAGERHGMAKLTDDMVRTIRTWDRDGGSAVEIARRLEAKYGTPVSARCVRDVINGRYWGHVK